MSTLSRRDALRLACLAAALGVAGCAGGPEPDPPGTPPAHRRPRPAGEIAFLGYVPEAALTAAPEVTIGYAASWYARAGRPVPPGLTEMPPFPGDVLIRARTNPDLCVQVEAETPEDAAARMDEALAGLPAPTWRTPVRRDLAAPRADRPLQRNPFGFVEGQGNPPATAPDVLRADGSSLLAVRVIRLARASWDADSAERQAKVIGRHPDGDWLDGTPADARPDHTADPEGARIPLDAHARAMNPGGGAKAPVMLRRSWSFQGPDTPQGTPDAGIVFMAFQESLAEGFALAQSRFPRDALAPYLLTVGGGYFHVP